MLIFQTGSCFVPGGSGGSIWIEALRMEGIGTVSARGGDGSGYSGGGSGGRISINTTHINEFRDEGSFHSNGGDGVGAPTKYQAGGGGTVYLEETAL